MLLKKGHQPVCRVLVVDESATVRKIHQKLLSLEGHIVVTAQPTNMGGYMWSDLKSHFGPRSERFDIVMCENQMRMTNGATIIRNLRQLGYKGITLVVTGDCNKIDTKRLLDAGADEVWEKPLNFSKLQSFLSEMSAANSKRIPGPYRSHLLRTQNDTCSNHAASDELEQRSQQKRGAFELTRQKSNWIMSEQEEYEILEKMVERRIDSRRNPQPLVKSYLPHKPKHKANETDGGQQRGHIATRGNMIPVHFPSYNSSSETSDSLDILSKEMQIKVDHHAHVHNRMKKVLHQEFLSADPVRVHLQRSAHSAAPMVNTEYSQAAFTSLVSASDGRVDTKVMHTLLKQRAHTRHGFEPS